MADIPVEIRSELDSVRIEFADRADWDDVLRRERGSIDPPYPSKRRSRGLRLALVISIIGTVAAAPAIALQSEIRGLLDGPAKPVTEEARLVVAATIGTGSSVGLWVSPSTDDGRCWFISNITATGMPAPERGGGACAGRSLHADPSPIQVQFHRTKRPAGKSRSWLPPVLNGWVDPALKAVRVEVLSGASTLEASFAGSYFILVVPTLYDAEIAEKPVVVVAYDSENREVARFTLPDSWLKPLD